MRKHGTNLFQQFLTGLLCEFLLRIKHIKGMYTISFIPVI